MYVYTGSIAMYTTCRFSRVALNVGKRNQEDQQTGKSTKQKRKTVSPDDNQLTALCVCGVLLCLVVLFCLCLKQQGKNTSPVSPEDRHVIVVAVFFGFLEGFLASVYLAS